jgi:hypothetical protein
MISEEIAKRLMIEGAGNRIPGSELATDLGIVEIGQRLYGGKMVPTLNFREIDELWVIIDSNILAAVKDDPTAKQHPQNRPQSQERENCKDQIADLEMRVSALETQIMALLVDPPKRTKRPLPTRAIDNPKTKIGKAAAIGAEIPDQPPTTKAYLSERHAKRDIGVDTKKPKTSKAPDGKLSIAVPAPQGKRVYHKPPVAGKAGKRKQVWERQLGYDRRPERVDIAKYSAKIKCKCGQVRWTMPHNATHPTKPVTQCKPCEMRQRMARSNKSRKARREKQKAGV